METTILLLLVGFAWAGASALLVRAIARTDRERNALILKILEGN